jgi:type II secretory pathway predicted ATPase ExeA
MQKSVYERYGLSGNPFRDLSSENLDNVDIFHVTQGVDGELARIKEEVFYKENRVVIAVLGGLGAGKTERLLLAANEAKQNNYFYVLRNMTFETRWVVGGILDLIMKRSHLNAFARIFSAPQWYRNIKKITKKSTLSYDPEEAGRIIAQALNENAPSFLLINDFHHLSKAADAERFLHVLHVLVDHIDQGVMVMLSSDQRFFETLMHHHPSLNERINRKIILPPLTDDEANLMVAKRLLEKRMVEDVDPLYPFTSEAIGFLNDETKGNPRRLLKLADVVIDFAANKRAIMIDDSLVREVLTLGKNQQLSIKLEENDPTIIPIIPAYENSEAFKKRKRTIKSSILPLSNLSLFHGSSKKQGNSSSVKEWDYPADLNSSNAEEEPLVGETNNPGNVEEDLQGEEDDLTNDVLTSETPPNQKSDTKSQKVKKQVTKKKAKPGKTKKPAVKKNIEVSSKKQKASKKKTTSKSLTTVRSQEPLPPVNMVKVKCPLCTKVFAMDIDDETEDIRCPYCEFIGSVS